MTTVRTGFSPIKLSLSILFLTALPAGAASVDTPESFVHRLYGRYKLDGPGVPMSRGGGAAFYTTDLLDAFAKDQAGSQSEGMAIDWDPICDCTDYNLRLKTVVITKGEGDIVKARVAFTNLGSDWTVVLTLSQTRTGWRIADVGDKGVKSILGLLKDATSHAAPPNDPGSAPPK